MNKTIASGMKHSPTTDATAPGIPRILVPTNTAMLTWLAPGRIRHMVMADRPPPNDANAMWLKVKAKVGSETRSAGGNGPSLMHEFRVVGEVVLVVLGRIERVGRVVLVGEPPVLVEDGSQPCGHGFFGD